MKDVSWLKLFINRFNVQDLIKVYYWIKQRITILITLIIWYEAFIPAIALLSY